MTVWFPLISSVSLWYRHHCCKDNISSLATDLIYALWKGLSKRRVDQTVNRFCYGLERTITCPSGERSTCIQESRVDVRLFACFMLVSFILPLQLLCLLHQRGLQFRQRSGKRMPLPVWVRQCQMHFPLCHYAAFIFPGKSSPGADRLARLIGNKNLYAGVVIFLQPLQCAHSIRFRMMHWNKRLLSKDSSSVKYWTLNFKSSSLQSQNNRHMKNSESTMWEACRHRDRRRRASVDSLNVMFALLKMLYSRSLCP